MRELLRLLALPAALLSFITYTEAAADALAWPYNLPPTVKYHPEHEALVKRNLEIQEKLQSRRPIGMRKMSEDEGEMFFLHYWDFGDETGSTATDYEEAHLDNASIPLSAPMAQHFSHQRSLPGRSLFARQWGACPAGSSSCTNIARPNSCCQTGDTCVIVTDTGNGDVGCCAQGQTCGSTISSCDSSAGQTQCSGDGNGGCCITGYACYDVGCVLASTQTVHTTLPVATVTTGLSSAQTSSATGTSVGVAGVGSVYTTTIFQISTVTAVGSSGTVTSATTVTVFPSSSAGTSVVAGQGPLTCSPGFQSCAASLGGGCCQSDYACGAVACSTASTSTTIEGSAIPPARPTTSTDTTVFTAGGISTTTASASSVGELCPTGFYMCSAYYVGGCCRVGRDCSSTSCPASESTAVISSGVTVIVPASATSGSSAAATTQGSCANGFFPCDAAGGGGCCPSGYLCGASCSATASGVANEPKSSPSEASVTRWAWSLLVVGVLSACGMIWL